MLVALKREFEPDEIRENLWQPRAREAAASRWTSSTRRASASTSAASIGRFSTFLEHVKTLKTGEQVTRYNALFHWAVPPGREIEAGREVGRLPHHDPRLLARGRARSSATSTSWASRTARKRTLVLAHKAAIDEHLASGRHPGQLHERLLGRPQRDQAERDLADRVADHVAEQSMNAEEMRES